MKEKQFESRYLIEPKRDFAFGLEIGYFGEDGNDDTEPNDAHDESNDTDTSNEDDKKKDTISLTNEQLKSRLERERKKALEEATKNIDKIIADALKKRDEEAKRKSDFEKMTEEERREALLEEREKALKEREDEMQEKTKAMEVSAAKNTIMSTYDKDQLPRRDLFEPVAEFMAKLDDDEKTKVYSSIKGIIEHVKKTMMKDAMKQTPPSDGGSNGSTFKSTQFAKEINANHNMDGTDKGTPWGSRNY